MNVVLGVKNSLRPVQDNLIRGKDRVVLGHHRVAGYYEGVSLVIVVKGFASNVDRTTGVRRREVGGYSATLLGVRQGQNPNA